MKNHVRPMWKQNETRFPRTTKEYLSVIATSTPSERAFSIAESDCEQEESMFAS